MKGKFLPQLQKSRAEIFRSFFGSIENFRVCFRYLMTFRTIYSSSERSEQFLVTECFFNFCCSFPRSKKIEQLQLRMEKIIGNQKSAGKVKKQYVPKTKGVVNNSVFSMYYIIVQFHSTFVLLLKGLFIHASPLASTEAVGGCINKIPQMHSEINQ